MHQRHQRLTEQLDGLQARRQRERANHAHLQRLVLTASTTCLLVISCKSRCTAGKVRRKARIARGRIEVNGADEVNPTLSSPISPCSARRATSTDLSTCASVRRVSRETTGPRRSAPRAGWSDRTALRRVPVPAPGSAGSTAAVKCAAVRRRDRSAVLGDRHEVAEMTQLHEDSL